MPIPSRKQNEDQQKFVSRCMGNESMKKEYPDSKQRVAICLGQTRKSKSSIFDQALEILGFSLSYQCEECYGNEEEVTASNLVVPAANDYIDFEENTEEYIFDFTSSKYMYEDTKTGQIYYYNFRSNHTKDGRVLVYKGEASEYQGKKVTLNKPFRTPDGPKKFSVYVKNEKGNVVKVNFGDPNMEIKKDIPARRKSFRARMRCETPGPKWKARYWACKSW